MTSERTGWSAGLGTSKRCVRPWAPGAEKRRAGRPEAPGWGADAAPRLRRPSPARSPRPAWPRSASRALGLIGVRARRPRAANLPIEEGRRPPPNREQTGARSGRRRPIGRRCGSSDVSARQSGVAEHPCPPPFRPPGSIYQGCALRFGVPGGTPGSRPPRSGRWPPHPGPGHVLQAHRPRSQQHPGLQHARARHPGAHR